MGKKGFQSKLSKKEATASIRSIHISPQKLNLVANLIRGLKADSAISELTFCRKRISKDVKKILESAIANAENNHNLDVDKLYIKEICVGKAFVLKRWRARARGRSGKLLKPFSNMRIILSEINKVK